MREDRALGAPRRERRRRAGDAAARRVLVAVYGTFALAAGARAAVQLGTRFDEAPVAYLLSALAAVGLRRGDGRPGPRRAAADGGWRWSRSPSSWSASWSSGTLSLADRAAFPDETVWSAYGRGYFFVPLVLPVLGLLLLRRGGRSTAQKSPPPKSPPPKSPPPKSPPPSQPLSAPPAKSASVAAVVAALIAAVRARPSW